MNENARQDDETNDDPQQIDLDELGDDGTDVTNCPFCGSEIYDRADRCDVCGRWLIDSPHRRKNARIRWMMVLIVAMMIASLLAWLLPVW